MKNKKIADILLVIFLIAFIVTALLKRYFGSGYIINMFNFAFEAALVGSAADWFAITALYKKPLGFSYHTEIIPRNREKIISSISKIVENELISPNILQKKLEEIDIIKALISYADNNLRGKGYAAALTKKYALPVLENIDVSKASLYIETEVKKYFNKLDLTDRINEALTIFIRSKEYTELVFAVSELLIETVNKDSTREAIYSTIDELVNENIKARKGFKKTIMQVALGLAEGTNSVNIMDASEAIQRQILEMLSELKNENSDLYKKLTIKINEALIKLTQEDVIKDIENWKLDTIASISIREEIEEILEDIIFSLKEAISSDNFIDEYWNSDNKNVYKDNIHLIVLWVKNETELYWDKFKNSEESKSKANMFIKKLIYGFIESEHHFIGKIVEDSMNKLTNDDLNLFIEEKAGNDLHWIRINGGIVGAILGVIVYIFINQIYGPLINRFF